MFEKDWLKPGWPERLVAEFESRDKLTRVDVIKVCGNSFFVNPWVALRTHGFMLKPTGEKDLAAKGHPPFYQMISKPSYMVERVPVQLCSHDELKWGRKREVIGGTEIVVCGRCREECP